MFQLTRFRRTFVGLLTLIVLAATFAIPNATFAATSRTRTFTEEQINSSYRVTNPRSRAITNRRVDLQPGKVVITATWTRPRKAPVEVSSTYVPSIVDGRVNWQLIAATVDGQPVSAEVQEQINARITASWTRFVKNRLGAGRVTNVAITDNDISFTITGGR